MLGSENHGLPLFDYLLQLLLLPKSTCFLLHLPKLVRHHDVVCELAIEVQGLDLGTLGRHERVLRIEVCSLGEGTLPFIEGEVLLLQLFILLIIANFLGCFYYFVGYTLVRGRKLEIFEVGRDVKRDGLLDVVVRGVVDIQSLLVEHRVNHRGITFADPVRDQ